MEHSPVATVRAFAWAIARGDLGSALAYYEDDAIFFAQPDKVLRGREQIREALAAFIALGAQIHTVRESAHESNGVALYQAEWELKGTAPDGTKVFLGGRSADVLRLKSDGSWRIAVDNPWGEKSLLVQVP